VPANFVIIGHRNRSCFLRTPGLNELPVPSFPPAPTTGQRCALQKFLNVAIFSNGAACQAARHDVHVAWSGAKVIDLQTKVQVYERKAAKCEERARQATDGHQRAFYEVLANYYGVVATDFRHVIEKRAVS
jgi:hypothetical protein